jgi:hypothetical protein
LSDRFREELRKQLGFIETSCAAFDSGNRDEAIRVAASIRVLIQESPASLLTHLGAKNINLLSTVVIPENQDRVFAFDGITLFTGAGPRPKLDQARDRTPMPVADWWEQVVFIAGQGKFVRRRDLVLTAANKDGGAHVDAKLPASYEGVIKFWTRIGVGETDQHLGTHLLALRQLGYEILNSPELIALISK